MKVERPGQSVPATHRRWTAVNAIALTAMVNLLVSGAVAWLSTIETARVPLWAPPISGTPSMITDTLGTLFLLPFITSLLVTAAIEREQRTGRLSPLRHLPAGWLMGQRLPRSRPRRSLVLAAVCTVALGPPAAAILIVTGFIDVSAMTFVIYKAVFGVALGTVVTPVIALQAMTEPRPARSGPGSHRPPGGRQQSMAPIVRPAGAAAGPGHGATAVKRR